MILKITSERNFWQNHTQSDSIKQVKDWIKYKISDGLELTNITPLKSRYT